LRLRCSDVWWDIEAGQDCSRITREVGEAVKTFGLPWLDAMADFETARQAVKDWPLQALGFDLAAGAVERARQRFHELVQGSADSRALRTWGRARGLTD